jgi:hypothetical protein
MISVTEEPAGTLLKVDGWLAGEGVSELVRVFRAAAGPVRLLAHDLRGADADGVSVLRRLTDDGIPIEGLSSYMQLLLAVSADLQSVASPTHPETRVRSNRT